MGRWMILAGSLAVLLFAGCAGAPVSEETGAGTPAAAGSDGAAVRSNNFVTPDATVDARDPNPGATVRCREILRPGSNVIVQQCMTLDDWKRFERRQELEAQEILRTLQGGAYR